MVSPGTEAGCLREGGTYALLPKILVVKEDVVGRE